MSAQLKVVVMSASLSVDLFVAYFRPERLLAFQRPFTRGNWQQQQQQQLWQQHEQLMREKGKSIGNSVMSLKVPGRTFPVSVLFLSEVLQLCGAAALPASYQSAASIAAAIAGRYKRGRSPAAKTEWREQQQDSFAQSTDPASKPATAASQAAAAAAGAPVVALSQLPQLVAAVVRHIHLTGAPCVPAEPAASNRGLRGNKQRQNQQKQPTQTGTAIIVFCCGMGEVSAVCRAIEELQMDLWVLACHASLHPAQQQKDVGYVIDCGTHKMLRYDVARRSSKLQEEMITQANAQQRAGRAGRVTEGLCLRLYEREEFDAMQNSETPELHRQALDNQKLLVQQRQNKLSISPAAVVACRKLLIHLGALEAPTSSEAERLTSLGFYLSHFPMNIAFARMLILAAPLGCLEETTALCALMGSDSDLYVSGADAASERNKQVWSKLEQHADSRRVANKVQTSGTSRQKHEDCESDIDEEGVTLRVDEVSPSVSRGWPNLPSPAKEEELKSKTRDTVRKIFWHIKACVVGGLYPQVATIQAPRTYMEINITSLMCLCFDQREAPRAYITVRHCIHCCLFLICLSGCEINVARGEGALWLDGWLQLRCAGLISSYVKHLKGLFNLLLNEFYGLSVSATTHGVASSQASLDYDALALLVSHKPTQFVFFGAADAVGRRNKLTDLIKRLVELEGHLL
ncbi:hypothetical protein ACSSS7_001611 [Eimeria intestinalis]